MKVIKEKAYVLCWCDKDMMSSNGIEWPERGIVEDPSWSHHNNIYDCFRGLLWGCGASLGSYTHIDHKWIVALVDEYIERDGYVIFPRAEVVFIGTHKEAVARLVSLGARFGIEGDSLTAPDHGKVIVGNRGSASVGNHGIAVAGTGGSAEAGQSAISVTGNFGISGTTSMGIALSGAHGVALAKGDYGAAYVGYDGTAITGSYGTAIAGSKGYAETGFYGESYAGKNGSTKSGERGVSISGCDGTAMAGKDGLIAIHWFDGNRQRFAVGYVGEDGIEPDTSYRVENGKLVAVTEN